MAELIRRIECPECHRELFVNEVDIDEDFLTCPHCEAEIPVEDDD